MKTRPKIIVIVGPNASGKSDLAVYLAKKFNGEVVSADSRQVYKYMDVGTGKVTKEEMQGIPHHLLSIRHPSRQLTVAEYKKKAQKAIADIQKRGKLPILVGGTGFYIDVVVYDVDLPEVPPNKALRKKLEKKDTEELYAELKKKDPRRARSIQASNKRRLIRALEIIEATGRPVPEIPMTKKQDTNKNTLQIGVKWPREELHKRIEKRLDKRFTGIIKETKKLRDEVGLSWEKLENFGLEYKWAALYLQEVISKDEMREKLFGAIKKYARRQMTWFKRDKNITWLELKNPDCKAGEDPRHQKRCRDRLQKEAAILTENFLSH